MGFIQSDREQLELLGHCIDDFVEEDSKARFIVKIVDLLDTKELYSRYSEQGADAIDPKLQLATWFLGYSESITSTRKLEYNCRKNLDFIYVSGNLRPDHTSLSRFRKQHLDLIPKYFVEIVRKAYSLGLSDFKEISVDGTKLPAVSSKKKSMSSGTLDERIKEVEKDIAEYLTESHTQDSELEELSKKKEKLTKAMVILEKRKSEIKPESRQSHQVNIEEPEATMHILGNSKGSFTGYNAQVSTDTKTQLIVSGEVVPDRNDEKQFINQYENTEKTLGPSKQREYIADSGYNSHQSITQVYQKGIDAYIADRTKSRPTESKIKQGQRLSKDDFSYDAKTDCYICPQGKKLVYARTENNKFFSGKQYKVENCGNCRIKHLCLAKNNKSGSREIRRDQREEYVELMRWKVQTNIGRSKMFRRKTTVEAVIGNIKSNMGYSRFRLKGLAAVNAEFMLMCIGHNLNKLFKMQGGFNFNPVTNFKQFIFSTKERLVQLFCSVRSRAILQKSFSY